MTSLLEMNCVRVRPASRKLLLLLNRRINSLTPAFLKRKAPGKALPVGLIGCGHIVFHQYLDAFNSGNSSVSVAAVFSRNRADSRRLISGLRYRSRCADSLEELLHSGIRAAIITAPNDTHYDYVMELIRNNIHVLCEKPLTTTPDEAETLKRASMSANVILMVGFNLRYSKTYRKLEELVRNQVVGDIRSVSVRHCLDIADHIRQSSWLNDRRKSGGGVLLNIGIHSVNLLTDLFGTVQRGSATFDNRFLPQTCGEDFARCNLLFENGVEAKMEFAIDEETKNSRCFDMSFDGMNGSIRCDFLRRQIRVLDKEGILEETLMLHELAHEDMVRELNRFACCVDNGISPATDVDDYIRTSSVIEALYSGR